MNRGASAIPEQHSLVAIQSEAEKTKRSDHHHSGAFKTAAHNSVSLEEKDEQRDISHRRANNQGQYPAPANFATKANPQID